MAHSYTLLKTVKDLKEYLEIRGKSLKVKELHRLDEVGPKQCVGCPRCRTWFVRMGTLQLRHEVICPYCKNAVRLWYYDINKKTQRLLERMRDAEVTDGK
jgi:uncharacterized Zn-finger protein